MRRTVGPLLVRVLLTCASSSRAWAHPARSARPRAILLIPADLFCPALDLVTFLILLLAMSKVGPDEPASAANSRRRGARCTSRHRRRPSRVPGTGEEANQGMAGS